MTQALPPTLGTGTRTMTGSYRLALSVLTSLFFMWGFITCLNDILIPHLKTAFSLSYAKVMLIQFTFFTAYALVSLPAGAVVARVGYKRGIVIGLLMAGVGCVLFYPAAGARSFALFLTALFVLASGITLLQVSANPYVAVLGAPETASSRLNLTQAFNALGTTVAPWFGAAFILSTPAKGATEMAKLSPAELAAYTSAEASSVQIPYLGLAAVLCLIAVGIAMIKLPDVVAAGETEAEVAAASDRKSAWSYRHLVLGALAIFVYVGAEVGIGSLLVSFMQQPDIGGLKEETAGKHLSYYWGGAMIGRFVGSLVLQRVRAGRLLALNAGVAAVLVVVTMLTSGHVAMWSLLAVGLFNSIMFPTIFTLAVSGLGRHTAQGSGILCMAVVGGAVLPLLQGVFADRSIHYSFFLPALCYLYVAWYGLFGSARRGRPALKSV